MRDNFQITVDILTILFIVYILYLLFTSLFPNVRILCT